MTTRTPLFSSIDFSNLSCGGGMVALGISWALLLPCGAADNTTNLFDGTVTNVTSWTVPTGTNNSLQILNGGAVYNSGGAIIGISSTDFQDYALVSGTNSGGTPSIWTNAGDLYVGQAGKGHQLIVTNWGQVIASRTIVGYNAGATGNTVIVTGTNSVLSNVTSLYLGWSGGFNQLIITNGGRVNDTVGNLGNGSASASNNLAVVTGTGSVWSNTGAIEFGLTGGGNRLTVSSAGRVDLGGDFNMYHDTDNNIVLVTGSNSLLSLPGHDTYVGGHNGQLTIDNGGRVSDSAAWIGYSDGTSVVVTVTGAGSVWSNTASVTVGHYLSSGSQLIVTNGGRVVASTVILGGYGPATSNSVVTVTGSNSMLNLTGALTIGNKSASNTLQILNGGRVKNTTGNVGFDLNASNNFVLVSGPGSVWSNTGSLNLGEIVGGNQLTITNGGRVDASDAGIGGSSAAIPDNRMLVTGDGSLLSLSTTLAIGGNNANLTIANSGRVVNTTVYIGNGSSTATNVMAVVTGAGSQWTNSGDVTVGYVASGTQLIVTNGGRVDSTHGYVSYTGATPKSNTVVVTGSNSLWNMTSDLFVGFTGGGYNQLQITDGGRVKDAVGNVGYNGNASNNSVLVSGPGSVWSNTSSLNIGSGLGGNQLTISNGGRVDSSDASIGYTENNRVLVTGSNSLWSVAAGLGMGGHNARLTISDGGRVVDTEGWIANGLATATNVVAIVSGIGAQWTNTSHLSVGYVASGAQLIITNGGRVDNNTGFVGRFSGSTNNSALVTGSGSLWRNNLLTVGNNGTSAGGGSVLVTDGGTIESATLLGGLTGSGTISNRGGIYQFPTSTPTITPNTANSIVISNGTISFRGVSDADVFSDVGGGAISPITYQGNNTFRLNSSSNTSSTAQNYTFDTGRGATNYVGLDLVNGTTLWRSGRLTIGSGGHMLVSNTVGTVQAAFVSTGAVEVANSTMTWASNVTIVGRYRSDPSTSIFNDDVTVVQSGTMAGGSGDLFNFQRSFFIHSTNSTGFNLASSAMEFSGGGLHTNAITGSDLGASNLAYAAAFELQTNFAYGELHLGSSADQICLQCGNIPLNASNALYVGWLDLLGSASLVANLHSPTNINIYYNQTDPRNSYLDGLTFHLTDCDLSSAGGFLIPVIPEPSALAWFAVALGCIFRRRR